MPGSSDRSLSRGVVLLLVALSPAGFPIPATCQVISPGELSEAHASLEGMANCTRCHQLRSRGVDAARCLDCHEPLAARIEQGAGYHGRMSERNCGTCHKEHFGKSFRLIHFEPSALQHDSTGYRLRGSHARVECGACHREEAIEDAVVRSFKGRAGALSRTYLGLGTECESCHVSDDPHDGQFADRSCATCHDETKWVEPNRFTHDAAAYPLDGRHREVECGACHRERAGVAGVAVVAYRPLASDDCRSCHVDPHRGGFRGRCDVCHVTTGWERVPRTRVESGFDHAATAFALEGAHREASCEACHDPRRQTDGIALQFVRPGERGRAYPRPDFGGCASCHLDRHRGELEGRGCDECHVQDSWAPPTFDLERHDRETPAGLVGAHRVTPCVACHVGDDSSDGEFRFRIPGREECGTCHREDDPHQGRFGQAGCELCHTQDVFLLESFDHRRPAVEKWVARCSVCHEKEQPHGDQFPGRECGECHDTQDFRMRDFDHSRTRFPLDGSHAGLPCTACHEVEQWPQGGSGVRYRPLATDCAACHGGGEPFNQPRPLEVKR